MRFVVDASIALSWAFEDEDDAFAVDVLDAIRSSEAIVPAHWGLEVVNGLLMGQRRDRIDGGGMANFVAELLSLPIVVEPVARRRAFRATAALARAHGLTTYDAAYLELALRMGIPLATLDTPLRDAAEAEGVPPFDA